MARTVKEIKDSMTEVFVSDPAMQARFNLTPGATFDEQFAAASVVSVFFYIVAFCAWTIETLFDSHRAEMNSLYINQHAHTYNWYINKAKAFMLGYAPVRFTSVYDTSALTDADIAAARIVTQASCESQIALNGGTSILLKTAKGAVASLEPLSVDELSAFQDYIAEIQDAGVTITCVSLPPDRIRMAWTVYYDPQILDCEGRPLSGGDSAVRTAIIDYVQRLSFNGVYNKVRHVDAVQKVEGVETPVIKSVQTCPATGSEWTSPAEIGITPAAGYFAFYDDADLVIDYQPGNILYE